VLESTTLVYARKKVESWPFCTVSNSGSPCQSEVGAAVDVTVSIKGTGAAVNKDGDTVGGIPPREGDAALVLSSEVMMKLLEERSTVIMPELTAATEAL